MSCYGVGKKNALAGETDIHPLMQQIESVASDENAEDDYDPNPTDIWKFNSHAE